MRKTRILIAAVAVLATITGGLTVTSRNDVAEAAVVWHDDFNGAAGSGVDTSKWNFDTGGSGFGNQELEYYTSGTSNVARTVRATWSSRRARAAAATTTAGTAPASWTSGRIQTAGKFTQQYGHIEARIQVPNGSGLWPAFWMLGGGNWPTDGEIDIMEDVGRDPNPLYGTLHGPGYSGGNGSAAPATGQPPWCNAFHNYADRLVAEPDRLDGGRLGVLPGHPGLADGRQGQLAGSTTMRSSSSSTWPSAATSARATRQTCRPRTGC